MTIWDGIDGRNREDEARRKAEKKSRDKSLKVSKQNRLSRVWTFLLKKKRRKKETSLFMGFSSETVSKRNFLHPHNEI